jgi:hypothetical protein
MNGGMAERRNGGTMMWTGYSASSFRHSFIPPFIIP